MVAILAEALDLLIPRLCAGCGREGVAVCPQCALAFSVVFRAEEDIPRLSVELDGADMPVWACARYRDAAQRMILAWKRNETPVLQRLLHEAIGQAAADAAIPVGKALGALGCTGCSVVPIPSVRRSLRSPSGARVLGLARAVVEQLNRCGLPCTLDPVLARRHGFHEQKGKNLSRRLRGSVGSTLVRRLPGHRFVILVDDVVASGSTLLDAEIALSLHGRLTLGAIVLAASVRPVRTAG